MVLIEVIVNVTGAAEPVLFMASELVLRVGDSVAGYFHPLSQVVPKPYLAGSLKFVSHGRVLLGQHVIAAGPAHAALLRVISSLEAFDLCWLVLAGYILRQEKAARKQQTRTRFFSSKFSSS